MVTRQPIIIWGATGQARVVADCLHNQSVSIVAVFDNNPNLTNSPIDGVPLYYGEGGFGEWIKNYPGDITQVGGVVAIGGQHGQARISVMDKLTTVGVKPFQVIHPQAILAHNALLGKGCQILAGGVIGAHAHLGDGCIVNTNASVDHDCTLGNGVHVCPGATLTGQITVGRYAMIGAGAVVLPNLTIGDRAMVGAGAVVTKNVAPGATVVGNPARPIH